MDCLPWAQPTCSGLQWFRPRIVLGQDCRTFYNNLRKNFVVTVNFGLNLHLFYIYCSRSKKSLPFLRRISSTCLIQFFCYELYNSIRARKFIFAVWWRIGINNFYGPEKELLTRFLRLHHRPFLKPSGTGFRNPVCLLLFAFSDFFVSINLSVTAVGVIFNRQIRKLIIGFANCLFSVPFPISFDTLLKNLLW